MVWFGFLQEKNDLPCRRILTGGSHFYVEKWTGVNILRESLSPLHRLQPVFKKTCFPNHRVEDSSWSTTRDEKPLIQLSSSSLSPIIMLNPWRWNQGRGEEPLDHLLEDNTVLGSLRRVLPRGSGSETRHHRRLPVAHKVLQGLCRTVCILNTIHSCFLKDYEIIFCYITTIVCHPSMSW
jgi:hypothetical protein